MIGIFSGLRVCISPVQLLKNAHFNEKHISLLGRTDVGDDVQIKDATVAAKGVGIGALVGVLAGVGLVAIPGIGVLYGVGAIAAAIAGFDLGAIGGTIVSVLAIKNMHKEVADRYAEELKNGKTLLSFSGNEEEVTQAKAILEGHGIHTEMSLH